MHEGEHWFKGYPIHDCPHDCPFQPDYAPEVAAGNRFRAFGR